MPSTAHTVESGHQSRPAATRQSSAVTTSWQTADNLAMTASSTGISMSKRERRAAASPVRGAGSGWVGLTWLPAIWVMPAPRET